MMIVIPSVWLTAQIGDQHIQLRVSEPDLPAVLSTLRMNHARSVSYAFEPDNKPGEPAGWPGNLMRQFTTTASSAVPDFA